MISIVQDAKNITEYNLRIKMIKMLKMTMSKFVHNFEARKWFYYRNNDDIQNEMMVYDNNDNENQKDPINDQEIDEN